MAGDRMKIALVSDVHANLSPLEAVAQDIRGRDVQRVVCLGDTVTIGGQPGQVLDLLQELACAFVMGNHDQATLEPGRAGELHIPAQLAVSLGWTARELTPKHVELIRSFSQTVSVELPGGLSLCCFHGSPRSTCELILPTMSDEDMTNALEDTRAAMLAGGHIHQQMYRRLGTRTVVNPGSVGCAWVWEGGAAGPTLMPWAEYAVIEATDRKTTVEMIRVPFDAERARRLTSATDTPTREWWLSQYASGAFGS
jgi:predicted phosphodiesterase